MNSHPGTESVKNWRSILTITVFVLINLPILHPFNLRIHVPRRLSTAIVYTLSALRIVSWEKDCNASEQSRFVRYTVPINHITAPPAAILFLLAATAIGRHELELGIIGDEDTGICPYDLVIVFLSLGYVANSIGAAGLIRFMVLKTIRLGKVGHRLYLDLYVCFFIIGAFLGNDPIMVVFLTYFVRVIENIKHPRAWIFTQFCIANIATGILVSSNPTNLVLTNAFNIRFVSFTANLVVPVVVTTVLLFPFLLYIVFHDESLIPNSMRSHDLPEELRNKKPRNINVPIVREKPDDGGSGESERAAEVELILNPYLDRLSSLIGSIIFGVTVVLLLALNAVYLSQGGNTDFWVTLPAAVIMLCWDLIRGWLNGSETRAITQNLISCAKAIGTVRLCPKSHGVLV